MVKKDNVTIPDFLEKKDGTLDEIKSNYAYKINEIDKYNENAISIIESDIEEKDAPIVKELKTIRVETLIELRKQLKTANFRDLIGGLKTITEISQLLQNKPTQNIAMRAGIIVMTPEQAQEVNNRFG